jgi:hypothetical protein
MKKNIKKEEIILKFPANDWKAVRWVINCFQDSVHNSYSENAPRRVEADKLVLELHEQARKQVNALDDKTRMETHYDT